VQERGCTLSLSAAIRSVRRADLQVEPVRRRRVIALVRRRVDVAAAAGVFARAQPALLELRFDRVGIEWRDAERDVAHSGAARLWRGRRCAAITAAPPPDDGAAPVADLALVLAAFIRARLPPEERRVERHGLLVVRDLERDVIEPHGLPARGLERRGCRRLAARGPLAAVPAVAVADLQIEAVGILHVEALKILAAVVRDRVEPALGQFRLDLFPGPWL